MTSNSLMPRIALRFVFCYCFLYCLPLSSLLVETLNERLFHLAKVLVPTGGSGDSSFAWAQLCTDLLLAVIVGLIWGIFDKSEVNYSRLKYWLIVFLRYYVAFFSFTYGVSKVFAMQMPPPTPTMLATPLGDLMPMRLAWQFFGYGAPYQMFSGVLETLVGVLLFFRRTANAGFILGFAVFLNVFVLNICFDIPVKLFSGHLMLFCLLPLLFESRKTFGFILFNNSIERISLFEPVYSYYWIKVGRIFAKSLFGIGVVLYLFSMLTQEIPVFMKPIPANASAEIKKFQGLYGVEFFVVNNDTIPFSVRDSSRWRDIVFENSMGSFAGKDSGFLARYGRARFEYTMNAKTDSIVLNSGDTVRVSFH